MPADKYSFQAPVETSGPIQVSLVALKDLPLSSAFVGGQLRTPQSNVLDFSEEVRTYNPDAIPVPKAHEIVGLSNVFGSSKPYDPEGKLAATTAAHERAIDLRDQGLPPSLSGAPQGGVPAPTPYPKW